MSDAIQTTYEIKHEPLRFGQLSQNGPVSPSVPSFFFELAVGYGLGVIQSTEGKATIPNGEADLTNFAGFVAYDNRNAHPDTALDSVVAGTDNGCCDKGSIAVQSTTGGTYDEKVYLIMSGANAGKVSNVPGDGLEITGWTFSKTSTSSQPALISNIRGF